MSLKHGYTVVRICMYSAYNPPSDPVLLCSWDVWVPWAATNCHHHSSSCDGFLLPPAVHMLAEKRSECKTHCGGCGKGTCCGNDLVSRCLFEQILLEIAGKVLYSCDIPRGRLNHSPAAMFKNLVENGCRSILHNEESSLPSFP